jgi:hypothetical protein
MMALLSTPLEMWTWYIDALRNTPIKPWVQLTGNKENFTADYFAWWLAELASKENNPKLAANATLYAEIIVDTHDLKMVHVFYDAMRHSLLKNVV